MRAVSMRKRTRRVSEPRTLPLALLWSYAQGHSRLVSDEQWRKYAAAWNSFEQVNDSEFGRLGAMPRSRKKAGTYERTTSRASELPITALAPALICAKSSMGIFRHFKLPSLCGASKLAILMQIAQISRV